MKMPLFVSLLVAAATVFAAIAARADDSFVEPPGAQRSNSKLMGQFVHGPLQGSFAFNLAAVIGGSTPAKFAYRNLTPLTDGAPFHVKGAERVLDAVRSMILRKAAPKETAIKA